MGKNESEWVVEDEKSALEVGKSRGCGDEVEARIWFFEIWRGR